MKNLCGIILLLMVTKGIPSEKKCISAYNETKSVVCVQYVPDLSVDEELKESFMINPGETKILPYTQKNPSYITVHIGKGFSLYEIAVKEDEKMLSIKENVDHGFFNVSITFD
jgi:hypothetical protein